MFRIDEWLQRFPLDKYANERFNPHGPASFCYVEQIHSRAISSGEDLGDATPTDVFVLAFGEPLRRDVTKIGGLPYRPADQPWPISEQTGNPLTFVAQFRFAESRDIICDLPGDILLTFFEDRVPVPYDTFSGPPVFEWYTGRVENPCRLDDIPDGTWWSEIPTCYGVRHRTADFGAPWADKRLSRHIPPRMFEGMGYGECAIQDRSDLRR